MANPKNQPEAEAPATVEGQEPLNTSGGNLTGGEKMQHNLAVSITVAGAVTSGVAYSPDTEDRAKSTRLFERWLMTLPTPVVNRVREAVQS